MVVIILILAASWNRNLKFNYLNVIDKFYYLIVVVFLAFTITMKFSYANEHKLENSNYTLIDDIKDTYPEYVLAMGVSAAGGYYGGGNVMAGFFGIWFLHSYFPVSDKPNYAWARLGILSMSAGNLYSEKYSFSRGYVAVFNALGTSAVGMVISYADINKIRNSSINFYPVLNVNNNFSGVGVNYKFSF